MSEQRRASGTPRVAYSGATAIESAGSVSADAILAWFAARGPSYAPDFAPDGQYQPPPPDLGQAIVDECQRYADHVINWDMTAAQILHETAAWQSKYARERNNPGGIGAVNNNPDLALTFPTVAAGVRAHVAHLLVYAVGDGPWTHSDPRRDAVARAGWLGVADAWQDLNGKWAYPGTTYAQQIAAQANILVAYAATLDVPPHPDGGTPMPPSDAVPIRVVYLPDGASNRPGYPMTPRFITIHETANTATGANAEMHSRYLAGLAKQGATEPSWHFTVDDHEIVQHLPTTENGWHAGDGAQGTGNRASIGIELCVNKDGDLTRTQHNAAWLAAKLIREQASIAGNVLANEVVQHNHWSGKDCPHQLRATPGGWAQFLGWVADELAAGAAPSPAPPDDELIVNGVPIIAGFRALWESVPVEEDRYRIFGLPLAAEQSVVGTALEADYGIASIQSFERCGWYVYQPAEAWTCTVAHHDLWPALEAAG